MDFGERIRARAQELGLSHSELSRRIGVDPSRVGRYIRGVNEPDLATLVRLCGALSLTPNDLLLPDVPRASDRCEHLLLLLQDICGHLTDGDLDVLLKTAAALKERAERTLSP